MEHEGGMTCFLNFSPIVWFGKISYGLYLFHQPVHFLLFGIFQKGFPAINTWQDVILKVLALLISLILAITSYYLLEISVIRYGHKFKYVKQV